MSNRDFENGVYTVIGGVVILILVIAFVSTVIGSCAWNQLRHEAVEHGYAEYDSVTGNWQWVLPAEQTKKESE
jgi:hypothetical protein